MLPPDEVLSALDSRPEGLASDEVAERLRRFGSNALAVHRVRATTVLFRQIRNPILLLLLGAALISGFTGGATNAVIIAVIVFLSVGLGFFNEYRAAVAMESLRAQIRQEAEVRRDGGTCRVPVTDLVPGDVVALRIGVIVPADLRLLSVEELECDEGILTGESMPVVKAVAPVTEPSHQDQPGCAFMGTIVHEGSALGVVVQTGGRTALGQIAAGLSERQGQTAFEVGLSRFSRFLFGVAAILTAFIFIVNAVWPCRSDKPAAICPRAVRPPVCTTTPRADPSWTIVPMNAQPGWSWCEGSVTGATALTTGIDSPVRMPSSHSSSSTLRRRRSAGTMTPMRRATTSPGTRSVTGTRHVPPSRRTSASWRICARRDSIATAARYSLKNPRPTLRKTITAMITALVAPPVNPEMSAAPSSRSRIGFRIWRNRTVVARTRCTASALDPKRRSRSATSSDARPQVGCREPTGLHRAEALPPRRGPTPRSEIERPGPCGQPGGSTR